MSARQWTDAQSAAIHDEGGALLVSAAAGSGKTAVLVERAVRLITKEADPLPADRLLILTFTYAAADELRSRIGARVEQAIRERPGDVALRRQRMLLRRAFIGTVDALCGALVREHFAALNVPPDVAVGDAALLESLAANAMADTMEEMYESPAFGEFAAMYGRARSDKQAEETVRSLYEFTRTLPHPKKQLARIAAMYTDDAPLAETPWGKELLAYAARALGAAARLCASAQAVVAEEEALAPYAETLAEDAAVIHTLQQLVEKADWDAAARILQLHSFGRFKPVKGYEGGGKQRVATLRDTIKKGIFADLQKYCFVCTGEEFEADRAAARPMVEALCAAASLFEEKFTAAKLAEKVLDFADFEHLALGLLQTEEGERTAEAERISARYGVVMVDEYQDTNELQSALYECLARPDGSNLFYVGDVKQSIYRFRKANPGLFLQKKAAWAPFASGRHPAVLQLGHNFRSGGGVIHGVNHVFRTLMSPALGDIEYNAEEQLIQGTPGGDEAGFGLYITEDATGGGDANAVAARIKTMVEGGYEVRDGSVTRPCGYGDFCILLRARKHMLGYTAALEAAGVPVVADMAGDLLQAPEVLPLSAALAAIDNPADDVNLAATLLGPLFRFTADEVAALRADAPRGSMWAALLASGSTKAQKFVESIRTLRARAAGVPVGRLCEELVERTGYLSAVSAMEGGTARRENLYRFIAWAAEASANGRGGLAGFVRLLEGGKGPVEPPVKAVPGHVTVLTIHKSKGLEFPVCILADAAHGFNKMDLAGRVGLHAQLGLGMMLRAGDVLYPTAMGMAIRQRTAAETMSEEMRILYVALTRAKDNMLVSFATKDAAKLLAARAAELAGGTPDPYLLSRAASFADWMVTAALLHPDAEPLLQYTGGVIPLPAETEGHWRMGVQSAGEAMDRGEEAYHLTATPDEALLQKLQAGFGRTAPYAPLAALPRKMSVSALAKEKETPVRRRPSFMYKTGLTAAERGSAQHAFMQFADFAAAKADTAAEVQRLVQQGYLLPAWAEHVDENGILQFLASDLYSRVENARQVLREYDFITTVPAGNIEESLPAQLAARPVMVQGIADLVLVGEDGVELVDYKTDRVKPANGAQELRRRYAGQLALYSAAIEKRLGLPVVRRTIWAFALGAEVALPLDTGVFG